MTAVAGCLRILICGAHGVMIPRPLFSTLATRSALTCPSFAAAVEKTKGIGGWSARRVSMITSMISGRRSGHIQVPRLSEHSAPANYTLKAVDLTYIALLGPCCL